VLRSDLICRQCGHTSTAFDPCVDVSLDLASTSACGLTADVTLADCLHRFTRPERLSQPVRCQRCASYQQCTKQMSVRTMCTLLEHRMSSVKKSAGRSQSFHPLSAATAQLPCVGSSNLTAEATRVVRCSDSTIAAGAVFSHQALRTLVHQTEL
jgi:hypothetical protein